MECNRIPGSDASELRKMVKQYGNEAMVTAINASHEGVVVRLIFDRTAEAEFCDYGSDILIYQRIRMGGMSFEKKAFIILDEPKKGTSTILIS